MERSLGAEAFDELAVMVDTFRRWRSARAGRRSTTGSTPGPGRAAGPHDLAGPAAGHRLRHRQPAARSSPRRRAADLNVRIGNFVLDLWESSHEDHHDGSLNAFLARGPLDWRYLRGDLQNELTDQAYRALEPFLVPIGEVTMHRPVEVADYVDFYSSLHHAENIGYARPTPSR